MRRYFPVIVLATLAAVGLAGAAAQTIYVRNDGSNTACSGLDDRAAGIQDPNCALATIAFALTDVTKGAADGDGDTIKLKAGHTFNVQVDITSDDPNITITTTDPNGPKPYIGGTYIRYNNPATDDWTLVEGTNDVYRASWTGSSVEAAYILDFPHYENERIGLIPYPSLAYLQAASTLNASSGVYYRGPGYFRTGSSLYVRLAPTAQVLAYEANIMPLFRGDYDPDNYDLIFADSTYSIRINASGVTIKNALVEANHHAIEICTADANIINVTLDEVTAWAGEDGVVKIPPTCASVNNITVINSQLYSDIPYWVSWNDCKLSNPVCDVWRYSLFSIGGDDVDDAEYGTGDVDANGITITRSHLRGGHDGIGLDSSINNFAAKYNRMENMADDMFELEAQGSDSTDDNDPNTEDIVKKIEIYGNFIANALVVTSIGQDSGPGTGNASHWQGPIYVTENVISMLRPSYVNSDLNCNRSTWNGSHCYGTEYLFKWGGSPPPDHNTWIYNNTIVGGLTRPSSAFNITGGSNTGVTTGRIFNNVLVNVNGPVGESAFLGAGNWTQIDYNLYYSMNNPSGNLAGSSQTIPQLFANRAVEEHGIGETARIGTNPAFTVDNGFGCFVNETCHLFDKGVNLRWLPYATAWTWKYSDFSRPAGGPGCITGRGGVAALGLPEYSPDPNGTIAFDPNAMGAIPCGASLAALNYEPQTFAWTGIDELGNANAINRPPEAAISQPPRSFAKVTAGGAVNFCATVTDPDGGPPYTYLWDFTGTGCPTDNTNLCPGDITFATVATCSVTFTATDRWGWTSPTTVTSGSGIEVANPGIARYIYVLPAASGEGISGEPSGSCGDCRKCICDRNN